MRIDIWHNILWSRYKAVVFSATHTVAQKAGLDVRFFQIAETEGMRSTLSAVDADLHRYPYELLFETSYEAIPRFRLWSKCAHRALKTSADLVILAGFDRPEYWLQMLILSIRGKRFGVFCDSTKYDNPFRLGRHLVKRLFFSRCVLVFCYGQRSREYVRSLGVPDSKIWIRTQAPYLPKEFDRSSGLKRRLEMAPRHDSAPCYLYVGRLSREKNLEVLIHAFAAVRRKSAAKLRLVGAGPLQDKLADLVRTLNVEPDVVFAGGKQGQHLFEEYARATCLVLPSRSEPWGLVVNEALSSGCPVIVSDRCGCVPELVIESKTGFTFRAGDIEDLTAKMAALPVALPDVGAIALACQSVAFKYTSETAATAIVAGLQNALTRGAAYRAVDARRSRSY